jgi:hypothetical protein
MLGAALSLEIKYPSRYFDLLRQMPRGVAMQFFREVDAMKAERMQRAWRKGQAQWQPLTPKYLAYKLRKGYERWIWTRTGDTLRAVGTAGQGPHKQLTITVNPRQGDYSMAVSLDLPYVKYADARRPWFYWDDEDLRRIDAIFRDVVIQFLKQGRISVA